MRLRGGVSSQNDVTVREQQGAERPVVIGNSRQLFLDDYVVDRGSVVGR